MSMIDLAVFRAAPLVREPFEYVVVPSFIRPRARAAINADYPRIDFPGSFPVEEVGGGPAFHAFLEEFASEELRRAFEAKFGLDLSGRPLMTTVRARCQPKDGRIHTDSTTKIITVLVYMNAGWEAAGGRLRLLRSPDDLEDYAAEVPPDEGTLLAFRRSDRSFHGHLPAEGARRVIQFNWVTSRGVVWRERARHRLSARLKRLFPAEPPLRRTG